MLFVFFILAAVPILACAYNYLIVYVYINIDMQLCLVFTKTILKLLSVDLIANIEFIRLHV